MDFNDKYLHWEDIAQYDLETAKAMFNSGRYLYVMFMCQQAIEKLVKGLYVLHKQEEPPRTHNISLVFNRIFQEINESFFLEEKKKTIPFFEQLFAYYISERYPSYKERLSSIIDQEEASKVLIKTEEVFMWLVSLKKLKK